LLAPAQLATFATPSRKSADTGNPAKWLTVICASDRRVVGHDGHVAVDPHVGVTRQSAAPVWHWDPGQSLLSKSSAHLTQPGGGVWQGRL
jgi:hypothetical protein